MRLSRVLTAALAVLALGGVSTACGKAADADKPDPNSTTYYEGDKGQGDPAPDASPSTPTLNYAPTPKTSTFDVMKTDGTTYTVTVQTGTLQRATQWLATGDSKMGYTEAMKSIGKVDVLGQGCGSETGVDLTETSRDAVVPIKLSIVDTTPGGYATEPEIVSDVYVGDDILDASHGVVIQQEVHFSDGYDCFVADGVNLATSLVATRTSTGKADVPGWLILKDYYSPNHPDGNPAKFEDVKLAFTTLDGEVWANFTNASGLFKIESERDAIAADGSDYTARVAMKLADLIG